MTLDDNNRFQHSLNSPIPMSPRSQGIPSYRPSVFYFRKAVREAVTKAESDEIGFALCTELESLKEWVRSKGLQPPRFLCTREEAEAKGWNQPEATEESA